MGTPFSSAVRAGYVVVLFLCSCAPSTAPKRAGGFSDPGAATDPRAAALGEADFHERQAAAAMAAHAYEHARAAAHACVQIRERWNGPSHADTLRAWNALADALEKQSRWKDAEDALLRALSGHEATGGGPQVSIGLLQRLDGLAAKRQAHGVAAERLLRALALREKFQGPLHPDTRGARIALIHRLLDACQTAQAEVQLRRAETDEAGAVDKPDLVPVLRAQARAKQIRGDDAAANRDLERAVMLLERDASRAATLVNVLLALAAAHRHADPAAARKTQERALAVAEQQLPADAAERHNAVLALGATHHEAGSDAAARAIYERGGVPVRLRPVSTGQRAQPKPPPHCQAVGRPGYVANAASVVSQMAAPFRRCYNAALQVDPNVEGSLRITATVGAQGEVLRATATTRGSLPRATIDCVLDVAFAATFSAPEGGAATIVIPVTFVAQ
jgi:tetratricopeptide (TPR) repeat protein